MTKEKTIEILEQHVLNAKPCSIKDMVEACVNAYQLLKDQPSLPSGLDEAAEKIASDIVPKYPDINWDMCFEKIVEGVKAGAEWMASQGEVFEDTIDDDEYIGYTLGNAAWNKSLLVGKFKEGDKVIVQIRKKDERR